MRTRRQRWTKRSLSPWVAPLAEEAARAESACILICDFTRPVPNGVILPPLIRTLLDAGMAPERITVLVATGLHRPNEGEELPPWWAIPGCWRR